MLWVPVELVKLQKPALMLGHRADQITDFMSVKGQQHPTWLSQSQGRGCGWP